MKTRYFKDLTDKNPFWKVTGEYVWCIGYNQESANSLKDLEEDDGVCECDATGKPLTKATGDQP